MNGERGNRGTHNRAHKQPPPSCKSVDTATQVGTTGARIPKAARRRHCCHQLGLLFITRSISVGREAHALLKQSRKHVMAWTLQTSVSCSHGGKWVNEVFHFLTRNRPSSWWAVLCSSRSACWLDLRPKGKGGWKMHSCCGLRTENGGFGK